LPRSLPQLSDTKYNLLVQQSKLLETEGVTLTFTDEAIAEIASLAAKVNSTVENIGTRPRLTLCTPSPPLHALVENIGTRPRLTLCTPSPPLHALVENIGTRPRLTLCTHSPPLHALVENIGTRPRLTLCTPSPPRHALVASSHGGVCTVWGAGARRLRTVVSKLMEDVSFNAHRLKGTTVEVTGEYVRAHTGDMASKVDVQKYIL
jgi:hypothetical protein